MQKPSFFRVKAAKSCRKGGNVNWRLMSLGVFLTLLPDKADSKTGFYRQVSQHAMSPLLVVQMRWMARLIVS